MLRLGLSPFLEVLWFHWVHQESFPTLFLWAPHYFKISPYLVTMIYEIDIVSSDGLLSSLYTISIDFRQVMIDTISISIDFISDQPISLDTISILWSAHIVSKLSRSAHHLAMKQILYRTKRAWCMGKVRWIMQCEEVPRNHSVTVPLGMNS